MTTPLTAPTRGMTYVQARRLVAVAGSLVLGILALVMYLRRVEAVEVVAVLLFFPVFLALLQWNEIGGLLSAVVAGAVYVALRWSAIHAVGFGHFSGLISSRVLGLVVFGALGGWANNQLRASLTKLDVYDQIDDATGLFNARFFLQDVGLEEARAARYRTFFAVSVVDLPMAWFAGLPRRQHNRLLKDLGRTLRGSIRTVDRAVHYAGPRYHRIAVILPETAAEGARIFSDRLALRLTEWLAGRGARGAEAAETRVLTFPGSEDALRQLRDEFAAVDHAEHPLASSPPSP